MTQNSLFIVERELIYKALGEIVNRIEVCGSSTKLTQAVILAGDLRRAIGNKHNASDPYAFLQVVKALPEITKEEGVF